MRRISLRDGIAAVLGGTVFGGGGGGDPAWGTALVHAALARGDVCLAQPDDLAPETVVAMAALVGAPAAPGRHVSPDDYWAAFELLMRWSGPVGAVMTNEHGGLATVNGWLQAARAGIPVLDCPGNGRAHPTGLMGSLNLDQVPGYRSVQACAGGSRQLRLVVEGDLPASSQMVRLAAVEAGGLVAVARNPTTVAHATEHGAPGAISEAIELGSCLLAAVTPAERLATAQEFFGRGARTVQGRLESVTLETRGGFDLGTVTLAGDDGRRWQLDFWNEYVLAAADGAPVGVFPDLVTTLDITNGDPIATADVPGLAPGHPIGVLLVPRGRLRLGRTMQRQDLMGAVSRALGLDTLPPSALEG